MRRLNRASILIVTTQVMGVNQSKQTVLKHWSELPKLSTPLISLANAITNYQLKKD